MYVTPALWLCCLIGKLIEIEQQSSLHTTMHPGWEDLVRRCMQMFLHRSEGQPWSYKRHYQEGTSLSAILFFSGSLQYNHVFSQCLPLILSNKCTSTKHLCSSFITDYY